MKIVVVLIIMLLPYKGALANAWLTDSVKHVSVKYGNGCILLEGGEVIKVDLSTDAGKVEMSLALTAFTAQKQLQVYQTDETPVGGCNSGETIKPHTMMNIRD